jgi:hypothetical protein
MVEILLRNPRILHQKSDDKDGLSEFPIAACTDASGLIVLSQEGRSSLVINRASVPELCQMLRMLVGYGNADARKEKK